MIFPFRIRYSRKLQKHVRQSDIDNVLNYVSDYILNEGGEEIRIDKNQLTFGTSFFNFRLNNHIFKSIDEGKFTLLNTENESLLIYDIFMYKIILMFLAFEIFVGYYFQSFALGIFIFGGLGVNWISTIIRHRSMFGHIISGINKLNTSEQ